MRLLSQKNAVFALALLSGAAVFAGAMDRPVGIKIGQRMTLKPYVSASFAYDSNVDARKNGAEDFSWLVSPGLGLQYTAETWTLVANVWYQYNDYVKGNSVYQTSYQSYGEDVTYHWQSSLPGEKGWSLMLSEKYEHLNHVSDNNNAMWYGNNCDRDEFKFAGSLQRRFTETLHANLNANYYWLDYDLSNKGTQYGLYGWDRWGVGLEAAYVLSKWTDLIFAGSYQRYTSENRNTSDMRGNSFGQSYGAQGVTAQIGIGSYATDRITYRGLLGWSSYEYDENKGESSDGVSYTVAANWTISDTWKTMILATSWYQPSEREFGSSTRVDSISWGITHAMVQGKLHASLDLAYRREGREYAGDAGYDYDVDYLTGRLGLTYILNRYIQFYGNLEYMDSTCEQSNSARGQMYDYDRFRGTLGLRFTY